MSLTRSAWRWWDGAALAVIVVGWSYLLFIERGGQDARPIHWPELSVVVDDEGVRHVSFDFGQWRSACVQAGLSDPPDLNGSDPIPVEKVRHTCQEWAGTRDGNVLGHLGLLYLALEQHEAALECFVAATELASDHARWKYFVGVECQLLGRAGDAIDALKQAAESDPHYPTTFARLGLLFLERGEPDQAERYYERYRELRPDDSLGNVGMGRVALARGDAKQAVRWLESAVERGPNDFLAHRFLSQALALSGDEAGARRASQAAERLPIYRGWLTFDERLRDAHRFADTQRYLENELRKALTIQDYASAAEAGRSLLDRRPNDADLMGMLAGLFQILGRLDDAAAMIERALAIKPSSPALLRTRAEILFIQKAYSPAWESVNALLEVDPSSARGHELLGRLLFLQGRSNEAIQSVHRALALNPLSSETRALLIEMLRLSSRANEAIALLREWQKQNPHDDWVNAQLRNLNSDSPDG